MSDDFSKSILRHHRYANDEQIEFMRCVHSGGNAVCEAVPGSGKTTCIVAMTSYLLEDLKVPFEQVLICAFNRDCSDAIRQRLAARYDKNARTFWRIARTYHSVGWEVCKAIGRKNLVTQTAEIYRNAMYLFRNKYKRPFPYPMEVYTHAVSYMKNQGCYAFPSPNGLSWDGIVHERCVKELGIDHDELLEMLIMYEMAKGELVDHDDQVLVPFIEYQAGRNPFNRKPFKDLLFLLVDELQDINEPQMKMVRAIHEISSCNVVAIGDRKQCVIAGTEITMGDGSTKCVEDVRKGDDVRARFGAPGYSPRQVTDVYCRQVENLDVVCIKTQSGKILKTTVEHMHFADFPSAYSNTKKQAWFVYLMRKGDWFRVGTTKLYNISGNRVNIGYRARTAMEIADAIWIISIHESDEEARLHEAIIASKYGLPTMVFKARNQKNGIGVCNQQSLIGRLFSSIDTKSGAEKLLLDYRMFMDHPHHAPKCMSAYRPRNITLTLCGDSRNADRPLHRLSVITGDELVASQIKECGFPVRKLKERSWRYETAHGSYEVLSQRTEKMVDTLNALPVLTARLGDGSMPFMPASHVRQGMEVWNEDGKREFVTEVWTEPYSGFVYDLNVDRVHNFIANGIVTHNSIYAWRGSNVRNIPVFIKEFNAAKHVISWNYRSGQKIVDAACTVFDKNDAYTIRSARTDIQGRVFLVENIDALHECNMVVDLIRKLTVDRYTYNDIYILSRTNAALSYMSKHLCLNGIPVLCRSDDVSNEGPQLLNCVAACLGHGNAKMEEVLRAIKFIGLQRAASLCQNGQCLEDICVESLGGGTMANRVRQFIDRLKQASKLYDRKTKITTSVFSLIVSECTEALIELTHQYAASSGMNMRGEFSNSKSFLLAMAKQHGADKVLDACYELFDTDIAHTSGRAVNLMTVHKAKGLENEVVIVLDAHNFPCVGSDPGSESHGQEANLLFVAMTRAKEVLFMSRYPKTGFEGEPHISPFLDRVEFDAIIDTVHGDKIESVIEKIERPAGQKIQATPITRKSGCTSWPDPIETNCNDVEFDDFKHSIVSMVTNGTGTFYLHRPDKSECLGKPGGNGVGGFIAKCLLEPANDSLRVTYEHFMSRTVKPDEERMKRQDAWLRIGSFVLANRLGDRFLPDAWRSSGWIRQVRAQADFINCLDTGKRKLTTFPVVCASLVAEVNGTPKLRARLKLQVSRVQARIDPDAYGVSDMCIIDSYPMWPAPILVWESTDQWGRSAKQKGQGFLPGIEAILQSVPDVLPKALEMAQKLSLESDMSKYWGLSSGGHLWIYKSCDSLWPIHPEDVLLIQPSSMRYASAFDFEAAAKERIYYSHLDGYNVANPECDVDAHVKRIRNCLKTMPIGGLEYLVAKDLKVPPQDVESEQTGMRIMFRAKKVAGMRSPSPLIESALGTWAGRSCKIKLLV